MDLMALEDEPAPKAGQELVAHVLGRRGEATKVRPSTVEPLHRTYFRDGQVRGRAGSQGNSGSQGRDEVVPHLKWVPQGFQKGLWGLGTQVETWFGAALSQVAVTTKFWGFCCENPKSFCMTAAVPRSTSILGTTLPAAPSPLLRCPSLFGSRIRAGWWHHGTSC